MPSPCSDEQVAQLAAATAGATGSDLAVLCREAAMAPVQELFPGGSLAAGVGGGLAAATARLRPVAFRDFAAAAAKLRPGAAAAGGS